MKRYFVMAVCLLFAAGAVYAATKEQRRLENCGAVLQEILDIPDNLPGQVLAKAECVIVFPSVLKLAFGMGKDYGRGAMVCRKGKEFNGRWGAPAMYALEGDSLGMQIGGESTDLILLVMNQKGVASILSSKIKLGGDASAAAGPKGRDASADTDFWMRAEILSYSRSRGLFAAISFAYCKRIHRGMNRSRLRQDSRYFRPDGSWETAMTSPSGISIANAKASNPISFLTKCFPQSGSPCADSTEVECGGWQGSERAAGGAILGWRGCCCAWRFARMLRTRR